jgi:oligosaccharide repeat unit polymerase
MACKEGIGNKIVSMRRSLAIKNSIAVQVMAIILQGVLFLLPLPIEFYKVNVMILFMYTLCISLFYTRVSLFHPYILFLCTFFLFMLSRVFLDVLGAENFAKNDFFVYHTFSDNVQHKILLLLALTLLFMHLGALLALKNTQKYQDESCHTPTSGKSIKRIALMLFYIGMIPYLLNILTVISYVVQNGYTSLYVANEEIVANPILKIGDDICALGFYFFLACFPDKKEMKLPVVIFGCLLILSLGIGLRGAIFTQIFTLIAYFGFRRMMNKKLLAVMLLAIAMLSQAVGQIRAKKDVSSSKSLIATTEKFLHSQGTSIMVVGLSVQEKEKLEDVSIFSPLLYMVKYSLVAKMLNLAPPKGQGEDFIKATKSLDATLAYNVDKTAYLTGNGMGTAMIAEFYVWGGYLGVILGSFGCLYFIIYVFERYKYSTLGMFLLLYVLPSFFFWPRSHPLMLLDNIVRPLLFALIIQWCSKEPKKFNPHHLLK